jgi:hypothetical protein
LNMRVTQRMLYKNQELLTLREAHGLTPCFLVRFMLLIFVCVVLYCFVILLCFCPMLCVPNVVSVSGLSILFAVTFNKHNLSTQSLNATISSSIYLLMYWFPKLHQHFNLDMTFLTWIPPPNKLIKDKC